MNKVKYSRTQVETLLWLIYDLFPDSDDFKRIFDTYYQWERHIEHANFAKDSNK